MLVRNSSSLVQRQTTPHRDRQGRTGVARGSFQRLIEVKAGAGDGLRTRYLDLGKVALYQVSYSRSARGQIIPWAE